MYDCHVNSPKYKLYLKRQLVPWQVIPISQFQIIRPPTTQSQSSWTTTHRPTTTTLGPTTTQLSLTVESTTLTTQISWTTQTLAESMTPSLDDLATTSPPAESSGAPPGTSRTQSANRLVSTDIRAVCKNCATPHPMNIRYTDMHMQKIVQWKRLFFGWKPGLRHIQSIFYYFW